MKVSDSKKSFQISLISSNNTHSYRNLYFKQLTTNLDQELFGLAIAEVDIKNEDEVKKIVLDQLHIENEDV